MTGRAAIVLDRDGVLNELVVDGEAGRGESPLRVADVRLAPGAAAGAARLRQAGFLLACATNQPAAAKGRVSVEDLQAVHARVLELLAEEGVQLDAWRMCLHHPDGVATGLSGPCDCRKPSPGMLIELTAELGADPARSWMIGDTDADLLAGRAAGCRTVMVATRLSAHKRSDSITADISAATLDDAASRVCQYASRP